MMTTVLTSLNEALHDLMASEQDVVVLGEDILDPYGGAFKVTDGLSSKHPHRVISTPVSEAGITGIAIGMALRGMRPILEIMFGDFVTLIADQIINHATKFRWMYNDRVSVPLIIRTPMGGRRGYGPTHSQTLEKLFLGVPGLFVLSPCALGDPGELLKTVVQKSDDPVLFIENKLLYPIEIESHDTWGEFSITHDENPYPTYTARIKDAPPTQLTMVAYGYMAEFAAAATLRLAYERELFSEIVVPTCLAPFHLEPILHSLQKTNRLITIEEGSQTMGWGAEIIARVTELSGADMVATARVGACDLPIASAPSIESEILPQVSDILTTVDGLMDNSK